MNATASQRVERPPVAWGPIGALVAVVACVLWSYWPIAVEMADKWSNDPTYSHGYLVPIVAGVILWTRRNHFPASSGPAWWGMGLVLLGAAMQLLGGFYYVRWLSGASIVPYLSGAVALAGGWPLLRWASPGLAFLIFMVPLPYRFDVMMQGPLRRISTEASGFLLQTIGLTAIVDGNTILLDDVELGVVDACSGLKMFIIFVCISTAVATLVRRPLADRVLIVLSAAPIAIVCNVARITLTGVMHEVAGKKWADLVFHDLAGWLMMPMALGLLWCELKLLDLLLVEPPSTGRGRRLVVSPIRVAGDAKPVNRP